MSAEPPSDARTMVEWKLSDETAVRPGSIAGLGDRRELSARAERILRASRTILLRDGYGSLTLAAIEREAGVSRALVHYYFGSKAGLLEAVVVSLFEDPAFGFSNQVAQTVEGPARAQALLSWQGRIIEDDHTSRLLFELLPHMMRDEDLRRWAALLYARYRDFDGACLQSAAQGMDAATLRALATLTVAVVEGLGVQRVIDADGVDHSSAFNLWRGMVSTLLDGGTKNPQDRHASS